MHWYLVYTKPRQEKCALANLERQGYQCFLPTLPIERVRHGLLKIADEPLFPRYLFIRLGHGASAKSWAPIRSTKGVSRLVSFGAEPALIADSLIEALRAQEICTRASVEPLFKQGERVRFLDGPFAGIEGVYQIPNGEQRVMVLIEIMSKQTTIRVSPANLHKVA